MATPILKKKAKIATLFRPTIYSRHPSHDILRKAHKHIALLPVRSVIRFGSSTECNDTVANGGRRIEINTVASIKNSASKLLMKQKFAEANVKTAEWVPGTQSKEEIVAAIGFPMVAKAHHGSKGRGNTLIRTEEEWLEWNRIHTSRTPFIFEKFMNFGHEFRLHVTAQGCFYACRKALKADVPEDQKWRRHDDICVWFLETNPEFHKPNSWADIEQDCINALNAIGADILSFDVRVQSPMTPKGERRPYQEYILLECNSASSMDNGSGAISVCAQKYIDIIPSVITRKANL